MLAELQQGAAAGEQQQPTQDASSKTLLIRGCDPVMAERGGKMLPPLLGNVQVVCCTDDDTFLDLLQKKEAKKYDAVCFAPGACRWDKARKPIPGGNAHTAGWTLMEYKNLVLQHQGPEVAIVETTDEKEMVPLLRQALKLS